MNQNDLIKKYLDLRFKDAHTIDDSPRMFVTKSDGKGVLRFGIMDDMPNVDVAIVLVSRKDVLALQNMIGLTYQKSEMALADYIINRLDYDTEKKIKVVPIDL